MRRAGQSARLLRAKLLKQRRSAAALLAAFLFCSPLAAGATPSQLEVNANARASGNRRAEAVALARVLLARKWPAQILRVRIDGVGTHAVAGIALSGVKFHAPVDVEGFVGEVEALLAQTFAASGVEETDLWTTVPITVGKGTVVSGDFAKPTTRIVFAITVRRADAASLGKRLRSGYGVFWAEDWKTSLRRERTSVPRGPKA